MSKMGFSYFRRGLSVLVVGMSTTSASAYLDPGTGSMILQVLLGGVAGLAIAGRLYWYKFRSMVGFRKRVDHTPSVNADAHRGE